jgi:hypothetical protein
MWARPNPNDVEAFVNDPDAFPKATRTAQIIVGALIQGVILFLAIALFLSEAPKQQASPTILGLPLLTLVATVFGAVALAASFLVPRMVADSSLRGLAKSGASGAAKPDGSGAKQVYPAAEAVRHLPLFTTQLVIGAALAEGAAFFAGLAFMIEHHYLALGVAGVALAVLISRFPTADGVRAWLDDAMARLQAFRSELP